MKKVVAIDIGASSGRVMLGTYSEHQLEMCELYRFENGPVLREDQACWNVDYLLMEIKHGIRRALEAGHDIDCIGIDTWGVDFVLIDKNGERLGEAVSYRDNRTEGCMSSLIADLGRDFIYGRTGIQFLSFNTLYQLVALKQQNPTWFEDVEKLLFIPDYLGLQLTGVQNCEYTNASTSQLLNCQSGQWDEQLLKAIGIPQRWLTEPTMPNRLIGDYSFSFDASEQRSKTAASIPVASIASHDTASAILALPVMDDDTVYISSGTWSLMGFESHYPLNSAIAQSLNFTNEGGAESRFRVLKNIMGLWLIQNVQKELMDYSFAELVTLAKQSKPFRSLIDPDHPSFLNPKSMTDAICTFCAQTDQTIPSTPGEFARCIFESLAMQYKRIWLEIKQIRSDSVNQIHIIGGGIQNTFLNQLCADACGVTVKVGPIEASAIGNVCGQLIALGELENVKHARQVVSHSFPIETYEPLHTGEFLEQWKEFQRISNVNL